MSTQARKMRGAFAKVDAVLQMSTQKKHHFQKIFAPAKDNQVLLGFGTSGKSNHLTYSKEKTRHQDNINIEYVVDPPHNKK